jgi:protein-tyrosine phosphatase
MSDKIRICFVCLGNICRSPTAEAVFRSVVERAGASERFEIDSAGTAAYHVGKKADGRSREHGSRRGYELTSVARAFSSHDFEKFDYVLAMDRQNLADLKALPGAADFRGHLALFREFDAGSGPSAEVPDPYYGGENGFEEVLDICERAARGLFRHASGLKGGNG